MSRFAVILVVLVLGAVVFMPPAEAAHQYGHRYMIFGRIVDAEGNPAQGIYVQATVETAMQQDPVMIIPTTCDGLYYTHTSWWDSWGGPPDDVAQSFQAQQQRGLIDGGAMHIHAADLPSRGEYQLTTEFGNSSGTVRGDMHRSHHSFRLDQVVEPNEGCAGQPDWTTQYVVEGRVQRDQGNTREDVMTIPQLDQFIEIEVTLQTADGKRTETVNTNQYGDYMAVFDNVTVEDGARITATWEGNTRTGSADNTYRASEVNIIVKDPLIEKGTLIFLGILLGAAAVVGGGFYAFTKVRENVETKKIRETSGRKRANR